MKGENTLCEALAQFEKCHKRKNSKSDSIKNAHFADLKGKKYFFRYFYERSTIHEKYRIEYERWRNLDTGETKEQWKAKSINHCIISKDPECIPRCEPHRCDLSIVSIFC